MALNRIGAGLTWIKSMLNLQSDEVPRNLNPEAEVVSVIEVGKAWAYANVQILQVTHAASLGASHYVLIETTPTQWGCLMAIDISRTGGTLPEIGYLAFVPVSNTGVQIQYTAARPIAVGETVAHQQFVGSLDPVWCPPSTRLRIRLAATEAGESYTVDFIRALLPPGVRPY